MSLDGLRAWIGEVERKLGMRTRVFLVLVTIAVGGAGAAIYLAIDARDSSVAESDVQALQEQLEAQIGAGGDGASSDTAELEAELNSLRAEVEALQGEGGKSQQGSEKQGGDAGGGDGAGGLPGGTGGAPSTGSESEPSGGAASDVVPKGSRLEELLEQTQEDNAQAEREQAGE